MPMSYENNICPVHKEDDLVCGEAVLLEANMLQSRISTLEALNLSYRAALEWLVNLGYGKGKAGGEIEGGEFEEALESGKQALITPSPVIEELREVVKALESADNWYGLDGDGISEPTRSIIKDALSRLKSRWGL